MSQENDLEREIRRWEERTGQKVADFLPEIAETRRMLERVVRKQEEEAQTETDSTDTVAEKSG